MKREPRDLPMLSVRLQKRLNEGLLIIAAMTSLFLLISFLTYHPDTAINSAGKMGDSFAELFFNFFGYFAYLFPFLILYWGWSTYKDTLQREKPNYLYLLVQLLGFMIIFMAGCALNTILYGTSLTLPKGCGGLLGLALAQGLVALFNSTGSILILCGLFLTGITLATGLSWLELTQKAGRGTVDLFFYFYESIKQLKTPLLKEKTDPPIFERLPVIVPPISRTKKQPEIDMPLATISENPVQQRSVQIFKPVILKPPLPSVSSTFSSLPMTAEDLPAIDLLDAPDILLHKEGYSTEELESLSRNVELRLEDFGISVQVVAVHPGPVVTRFEMQLAAGIKVSRITSLVKDLARSLSVISVRIVEVIPGKSVVGLEVPNKQREIVRLSEIINSAPYKQAPSPLSLALGKDIAGHPVIVDLGKMPHLLVAGTTGSGKSVGLNAMLLSILYKATPAQVRLIMIDPKMLELAIYEGIPHLLAPVVTNMKEAANALRWCVAEMERRYKVMAKLGVRNLAGFNQKIEEASDKLPHPFFTGQPGESEFLEPLPYLVVLVDEFADMMMVVGKKVEELIARIAQKARAAGIHLILATQRPSVDVITGLIKANIPTRMAFQVSSKIDSRTILDQQGAEQLLGYGDMLYLAPGAGVPVRVHGAFVADHEVHKVVKALKEAGAPDYVLSITENNLESLDGKTDYEGTEEGEQDVLYDQAVQIIIETRRASISNIQRRLKIGYNRAARLMEDMEKAGLVSAMESNGNREVLLPAHD